MDGVFIEGSRDVSVAVEGSSGRATVYVTGGDEPVALAGVVTLEGPWVHVKADAVERTFPMTRVAELVWQERRT